MVADDLSLDELTKRLNQALAARGLDQVKPRTMYRYVEKELVPSPSRGPDARYQESSIPRLVFVKLLQAKTGLSLDQIAEIVKRLPPQVIESVASGREPLEVMDLRDWVVNTLTPRRVRAEPSVSRTEAVLQGFLGEKNAARELAGGRYARLGSLGAAPEESATPATALARLADPDRAIPKDRERRWTWVEVGPNFAIGARGLGENEATKLEAIAQWLRQLVQ